MICQQNLDIIVKSITVILHDLIDERLHIGCLGSALRKKVFQPFLVKCNVLKKRCSNCNEGQNWMSCTVIIHYH